MVAIPTNRIQTGGGSSFVDGLQAFVHIVAPTVAVFFVYGFFPAVVFMCMLAVAVSNLE